MKGRFLGSVTGVNCGMYGILEGARAVDKREVDAAKNASAATLQTLTALQVIDQGSSSS